ncbi:MAG: DUF885 domain-containing protein [Aeromicrobium erythreum]
MSDATRNPTPLDAVCETWVDELLALEPELHVELGRPGREGEYADLSPDGHAAAAEARRAMLRRVEATEVVDATDEVTRAELLRTLRGDLARHEAGFWQRDLNVIASPAQGLREIFDLVPRGTTEDWEAVALRLVNLPTAMDGYLASLREGVRAHNAPALRQVREVADQVAKQVPPGAFLDTLADDAEAAGQPATLVERMRSAALEARGAYARLVDVLRDEVAPAAPDADGVGRELYALASAAFVGVEVDLDETYAWGVEELARMVAEQEAIAATIVPGGSVADAVAHLESDPASRLHGTEALQRWMQETSDRAVEELGRSHFDIPEPMRRLECLIAPTQEGGIYYTPPSEDFSRPGRMWWSVPEGVTEFDAWRELTTVYHEGVPGHHLQLGVAVANRAELNTWRRLSWNSGHGEGWALYAERLMDELGYLDAPADRLGMLDGQRMRAARVVVDLGVHLGLPKPDGSGPWRGEDAFDFMASHVSMNAPFVRFEVNRYLGWPGQAPSYKVGQRLWEQLRTDWVAANGDDLRRFHREALAVGSVGMGTLRDHLL